MPVVICSLSCGERINEKWSLWEVTPHNWFSVINLTFQIALTLGHLQKKSEHVAFRKLNQSNAETAALLNNPSAPCAFC